MGIRSGSVSTSKRSLGTQEENEAIGFANILTDEEYFKVMKTIGILDEESTTDFSKSKAWNIINKWFDKSPDRKMLPS